MQGCYTESEVRGALTEVGFAEVSTREAERDLGMAGNVGRTFFRSRRAARH